MSWKHKLAAATIVLSSTSITPNVQAQTANRGFSDFVSGAGTILYLGGGSLLPLLTDGADGGQHTLRILDAVGTSAALCYGLKEVIRSPRPDNERELDSFPSCHATTAFALARVQSHYHPDYAILWYSGAALIGYSRIDLNRHRAIDVLVGAGLGYLVGEIELGQKRGLLLFPLIRQDAQGNTVLGLQVKGEF
ncbi:phosphatase PAP2 family protein [Chamaesiphon minutus]|uniref:Membrane-associated phospholipid phosphatase n=1 Tax=Chamaesiphon minutus (strain ATCC 27169 / PCC 6605) TaxID=1173020 RepID=K9UM89_CHAP6|nr:phosphatase PAP2 family protein [Chamaesiphon minutus]AFY96232.1 membrane-associated phospholipid phosphatase [Chamaesiphon minutus PCC 6605]